MRIRYLKIAAATPLLFFVFISALIASPDYVDSRFFDINNEVETSSGVRYASALNDGFLISKDHGQTWRRINNGLPKKIVYPFNNEEIETLTSIGFNPVNESSLFCTTASKIYISENAGVNWTNLPVKSPISRNDVLTSVSQSPFNSNAFLVTTTFSGIYETLDGGKTWAEVAPKTIIYRGAGFQEEIASVAYSPTERGVIYLAYAYGNGLYKSNASRTGWTKIKGLSEENSIVNIQFCGDTLKVSFRDGYADYNCETGSWSSMKPSLIHKSEQNTARISRMKIAEDRKAIYVGTWHATGERLQKHLAFMERNGLDSIIVDIKDDYGFLTYGSKLEMPNKIGAVKDRIHIENLVAEAHKRGFYVIGRIVVFKDKQLYNYNNYEYALQDKYKDGPWRNLIKHTDDDTGEVSYNQLEFWVDPFKEKVWRYNAEIAEELQSLGVDEIQFDYIRLPTDGDLSRIDFSNEHPGMTRINALESFFKLVRQTIHVPISTDLYGFNCYYRMGNWNGQNIDMFSNYVDVICPMWYPS
ncbi:MAG: putative glycoside hydrolase, partial [Spirochaetales bacterium]|nr:putative glycoside hydrolase [Spirochaetales bacterium]